MVSIIGNEENDGQVELVYARSRMESGFSPLVVYLPTK